MFIIEIVSNLIEIFIILYRGVAIGTGPYKDLECGEMVAIRWDTGEKLTILWISSLWKYKWQA